MGCSLLIFDLGQFSTHELALGVEVDPKSNFYFIKESEPAVSLAIPDVELPNVGTQYYVINTPNVQFWHGGVLSLGYEL